MVESEDPWSRKRRQNSEKILQVTERANQRREEVEKKFEESRSRGIGSDSGSGGSKILKKSKDDEPYDIRMSGWDKEDNLGGGGGLSKNDGPYFRQQMPQLMDREGSRDFRDRDRDYNRPGFNTPPRFQKQMVAPPGREPQGGYEGNRWGPNRDPVRRHNMPTMGNQQHGHGGYIKNMQGQLLRGRPQLSDMADIPDNMTDRLVNKEVDDKGSRPINDDRDSRARLVTIGIWTGRRKSILAIAQKGLNVPTPEIPELRGIREILEIPSEMRTMPSSDDMADKSGLLKDEMAYDKKKDSGGQLRDKDGKNARSRGERGPRSGGNDRQGNDRQGNDRQGNDRQGNRQGGQGFNSNSSNYFFQRNNGGPAPYSRENDSICSYRRRPHGKGGFKDKMAMSDSDGSLDEMSVSTESGKEDKKTDRRHGL
ncbi:unnamed protein product, partial [Nesidiocoris tenuis]